MPAKMRSPDVLTLGAVIVLAASSFACGDPGSTRGQAPGGDAIETGLLQLDDLPTGEPYDEWTDVASAESTDHVWSWRDEGSYGDSAMPACADLTNVDTSLGDGLAEMAESHTFVAETEGTPTILGLLARNTVYEYESAGDAGTAFARIDTDIFEECIGENVTRSARNSVSSDIKGARAPGVGDEATAFSADLDDSKYYDGYDNSTVSELIAVRVGESILVFQFIGTGQYWSDFDDERIGPEIGTVETVVDRVK